MDYYNARRRGRWKERKWKGEKKKKRREGKKKSSHDSTPPSFSPHYSRSNTLSRPKNARQTCKYNSVTHRIAHVHQERSLGTENRGETFFSRWQKKKGLPERVERNEHIADVHTFTRKFTLFFCIFLLAASCTFSC